VDVYAFGVILWELISAQDFFGEISFMSSIEEKILAGTTVLLHMVCICKSDLFVIARRASSDP